MKTINHRNISAPLTPSSIKKLVGSDITLPAWVYKIRRASGLVFVTLRTNGYMLQAVYIAELCQNPLSELCEGAFARFTASVKEEKRADYGFELTLKGFEVLSRPCCEYPIDISSPKLGVALSENLANRSAALRHPTEAAIMRVLSAVSHYFEEYMYTSGFTKIHTPKTALKRSDNGNNFMKLNYFGTDAVLTQSPCLYKHMALGTFDRVYEVGAGYFSKNTNGSMLLSEYTRLDFELSFVNDINDVTALTAGALSYILSHLADTEGDALAVLNNPLPPIHDIPVLSFTEAMDLLGKPHSQPDLDPTDTAKLCSYVAQDLGCEFVFVTDLPAVKQPFYVCDSKTGDGFSDCFVLLFRGAEVASGSRNICDCEKLINNMTNHGIEPSEYEDYLSAYKYGIPPHGGCAFGLERLTAKLLNLTNIRQASMFPRDLHHITP